MHESFDVAMHESFNRVLKTLERDPNCPPERPSEEILHEVMCSECGAFDADYKPIADMCLCKTCAEAWKAYYEAEKRAGICSVCASEEYTADELQENRCPTCYEEFNAYIGVREEEE